MSDAVLEPIETLPLVMENVQFSIDDSLIVSGLTLQQPPKSCSCILGNTGCGKSTLLKLAAGLLVPDSGAVLIHGKNIYWFSRKQEEAFRKISGFVFQNGALWQNTSVYNNVALPLQMHFPELPAGEIQKRVRALVEELGYFENVNVRPSELSVGEQKLIAIARALIVDPEIVYMDDPTANLDEESIDCVFSKIQQLKKRGCTLLIASNNEELIYRFADYLGVMRRGKLELFDKYENALGKADKMLKGTLGRLKARGKRACTDDIVGDGSEMSNRSDI